jgi:hypothetical protein
MKKENQQTQKTFDGALIESVALPDTVLAQSKFDEYLIEAIDKALTSLGAPVKNTVYFQLENSFNIPKNNIPNQISKFSDVMHKIFGLGASRLEVMFMKNLHSKIKVNFELAEYEWPLSRWILSDISFTEYVDNARKNFCEQQQKCGELCSIEMVSDNEVVESI